MGKEKIHRKFTIYAESGNEEYDNFALFDKRRQELKKSGVLLTYQLNSGVGHEFFTNERQFYDRMRHLRNMSVPFFPLALYSSPDEPEHYVSLNWIEKQKRPARKQAEKVSV